MPIITHLFIKIFENLQARDGGHPNQMRTHYGALQTHPILGPDGFHQRYALAQRC